jgi:hypothetical protein
VYFLANLASTVIVLLIYRVVTPTGWSLRAKLSNRTALADFAICAGLIVLWGFLLALFLSLIYETDQASLWGLP